MFFKAPTCIVGAERQHRCCRKDSTQLDWEVELGVVIGRTARYVDEKDALRYVAGYCVDQRRVRARVPAEAAARRSGARARAATRSGRSARGSSPTDEIKDPQNLDMWLDVNGERRQTGNTQTMIFGVAELVADVSQVHDAAAGRRDHHRHAAGRRPRHEAEPQWLKAGDVVTLGIQGLGEQKQKRSSAVQRHSAEQRRMPLRTASAAEPFQRDAQQAPLRQIRASAPPAPNVHGAMRSDVLTRLTSAPSAGVAMVTTSPTTCVKPWPGP